MLDSTCFTRFFVTVGLRKICSVLSGIANLQEGNRVCMVFQPYLAMGILCYESSLRGPLFQGTHLGKQSTAAIVWWWANHLALLRLTLLLHKTTTLTCCPKDVNSTTELCPWSRSGWWCWSRTSVKRKEITITSGKDTALGKVTESRLKLLLTC